MSEQVREGYARLSEVTHRLGVGRTTAQKWFDEGLLRGYVLPARGDRVVELVSIDELAAILRIPREMKLERDAALEALREHNRAQRG